MNLNVPGDAAVRVERQVGYASHSVLLVVLRGRERVGNAFCALADAAGVRMAPIDGREGAHFFAGVENNLLAARAEHNQRGIELVKIEIGGIEDSPIAIHNFDGIRREPRGAQHGQIEHGDVFTRSALLRPGVLGVPGFLDLELLHLCRALLARVIGVVEGLHRVVELFALSRSLSPGATRPPTAA